MLFHKISSKQSQAYKCDHCKNKNPVINLTTSDNSWISIIFDMTGEVIVTMMIPDMMIP